MRVVPDAVSASSSSPRLPAQEVVPSRRPQPAPGTTPTAGCTARGRSPPARRGRHLQPVEDRAATVVAHQHLDARPRLAAANEQRARRRAAAPGRPSSTRVIAAAAAPDSDWLARAMPSAGRHGPVDAGEPAVGVHARCSCRARARRPRGSAGRRRGSAGRAARSPARPPRRASAGSPARGTTSSWVLANFAMAPQSSVRASSARWARSSSSARLVATQRPSQDRSASGGPRTSTASGEPRRSMARVVQLGAAAAHRDRPRRPSRCSRAGTSRLRVGCPKTIARSTAAAELVLACSSCR